MTRRRGFTVTQLLAVIAIIVILIAFLLPVINRERERNNRIKCASNLKQIGLAMQMYSNGEKNGSFPRTYFDKDGPEVVDLSDAGFVDHGTRPVDSFSSSNLPASANLPANSVGGSFFLLLKTQDLTPAIFICPSSNGTPGFRTFSVQHSNNFGGWGSASAGAARTETIPDVTYSYGNPFPSREYFKRISGFKFNTTLSSDFALAADANPGIQTLHGVKGSPASVNPGDPTDAGSNGRGQVFGNSVNHRNQGQNVLYGDGHVEFQTSCWCGPYRSEIATSRDNIYTNGTQSTAGGSFGADAMPQDPFDSVCLPTSN